MRYLLDTNVLSDARLRRAPTLTTWISSQEVGSLTLSVVTLLELERGVRRSERRDPAGATPLRRWLDETVRPMFEGRILPIDETTAITAAALHIPDPMPEMDALIAATALTHDLTLVTHNTKDFARTSVRLLDPWQT